MPESNKKRRAWHGQRGVARRGAVLGTGQMPVASPSSTVPLASVYGVTEYCYRGPRTESSLAKGYSAVSCTNFTCSAPSYSPFPPLIFFSISFSLSYFFLFLIPSSFSSSFFCSLRFAFAASCLRYFSIVSTTRFFSGSWISSTFFFSFLLLFLNSRKTIHT